MTFISHMHSENWIGRQIRFQIVLTDTQTGKITDCPEELRYCLEVRLFRNVFIFEKSRQNRYNSQRQSGWRTFHSCHAHVSRVLPCPVDSGTLSPQVK